MRRPRILILFAIILLLGVAAIYLLTRGGGGGQPAQGEQTPVVAPDVVFVAIAAQDIARGARIPDDGVVMSRMPANMVVETMISGNDEEAIRSAVVGRIARQDIGRGVPITEAMISEGTGDLLAGGSDASLAIPAGYTAIAIPMDRLSGVAYALKDGDVVDVLVSMLVVDVDPDFQTILPNFSTPLIAPGGTTEFPSPSITGNVGEYEDKDRGNQVILGKVVEEEETGALFHVVPNEVQRPRAVTQRLVDSAQVLHVGTFALEGEATTQVVSQQQPQGAGAPAGQEGQQVVATQVQPPDIITLIVTPQDALALNWAMKVGADLTLTLRAPNDSEPTETISVTLQYLIESYNITVPSRLSFSLQPRVDQLVEPKLPNDSQPTVPQQ
ncbi:MAG: SAF domain-containing protein [Anaerolineales bacterium]|jgi:Flp pilus assembly protein CpaB